MFLCFCTIDCHATKNVFFLMNLVPKGMFKSRVANCLQKHNEGGEFVMIRDCVVRAFIYSIKLQQLQQHQK